jgi:hypothetical protein
MIVRLNHNLIPLQLGLPCSAVVVMEAAVLVFHLWVHIPYQKLVRKKYHKDGLMHLSPLELLQSAQWVPLLVALEDLDHKLRC